jgi:hypothetical protein
MREQHPMAAAAAQQFVKEIRRESDNVIRLIELMRTDVPPSAD